MKSVPETVLLNSPIFLQNIAISLYGLKLRHIRHGKFYSEYFDKVKTMDELDRFEIMEHTNRALRNMVQDAVSNVPYYKQIFQREQLLCDDIQTINDLPKIPLLEKSTIRKTPLLLVNKKYNKNKLLRIHTTGTTGTPLKIFCDNLTRQKNYAFYDQFLKKNGINYKGKKATLGGRIVVPINQKKPPFWRHSYFQKNLLFSSYHLTDQNLKFIIDKLIMYQPEYIDAYPSSLYVIAKYAQNNNINLKKTTKGITTSAETLFQNQREVIESTFDAPIIDQYGAAEMCIFVGQCMAGKYHINTNFGFVEIIDNIGNTVPYGKVGEIVCTGFINNVMPLIRYRIGDVGAISAEHCRCGSPYPVMEKLLGRVDDMILTPDGRKIGRLSPVLKGFPVKEAQYVQKDINRLIVFIVKDTGYCQSTAKLVTAELRKRLGYEIAIQIKYVNEIPRSSGNKFKSIVSKVPPQNLVA